MNSNILEGDIVKLIDDARLGRELNPFFVDSSKVDAVEPVDALAIAYSWERVTKAFLFTTLQGVGSLAREAQDLEKDDSDMLTTMTTLYSIIGDDLCNTMEAFQRSAPKGIAGIHYVWWNSSIVKPLEQICTSEERAAARSSAEGCEELVKIMRTMGSTSIGAATQVRVVEAIALDISLAFKHVFSNVKHDGENLFSNKDLEWINAHIRAEVSHNEQVTDHDSGMTVIANTEEKCEKMKELCSRYSQAWGAALENFANMLRGSHRDGPPAERASRLEARTMAV